MLEALPPLKILQIGAGRFGQNYLRILKFLALNKNIELLGVVVRSDEKLDQYKKEHNVPFFSEISVELLGNVDAVCVVTPPETHFQIVSQCVPYVHVLCEKPLCVRVEQINKLEELSLRYNHQIMVGHIFRFHALSLKLKQLHEYYYGTSALCGIEGEFINPVSADQGRGIALELMHWFDLVSFFIPGVVCVQARNHSAREKRLHHYELGYRHLTNSFKAIFSLGWQGVEKRRYFLLRYSSGVTIKADYITNTLEISGVGKPETILVPSTDALEGEIKEFLNVVRNETENPVPPQVAIKSAIIAEMLYE